MSHKEFYFLGKAPLSKSLLNRAFIVKSWFPDFSIQGTSLCDDIVTMSKAIENLKTKKEFDCGLSATAFRFLAVRLSREQGEFLLTGEKELFQRPLEDIQSLLAQLSVTIQKTDRGFILSSNGWQIQGDAVYVSSEKTSQHASALLLNSWNLDQDLFFSLNSKGVSYPYFQMTLNFVKDLGMQVQKKDKEFFIPKQQTLKQKIYTPEQDKSCLFALASFAVLKGKAVFLDWEDKSEQADSIFPDVLKQMGVSVEQKNKNLVISKTDNLKALSFNLKDFPDLFPLLSVLCAKAEGLSELSGLSHLVFKESNRLNKIKELLENCGIQVELKNDRMFIKGQKLWSQVSPFVFDTAKDHRLVMAGELVSALNVPITIQGKEAVNKSFPEFYNLI